MDKIDCEYSCSYDRYFDRILWVDNGYDGCAFKVTFIFHRLKLMYTTVNKNELSALKAKAKEYLKELTKNHLL